MTTSAMRNPARPRAATGDGGKALTIDRSGAFTSIGRK